MPTLSTSIANKSYASCFMNAAGVHCQTVEELNDLVTSAATTFVTKTATLEYRPGNPEPRYYAFGQSSINSMGLPNHGIDYYLSYLESLADSNHRFLSIAPIKPGDLTVLIEKINQSSFDGLIELNLSCPNIPGKPQTGYDFQQSQRLIQELTDHTPLKVGVKLPPYFDFVHFDQMAEIINDSQLSFITCVNSLGNGLVVKDLAATIAPKHGFGGIGGAHIKPTALANIFAFRQRLKDSIHIIGAGGVLNGRDAFEHILCGADLVQVGTQLYQEGVGVFQRLEEELLIEMQHYGYQHLSEFKGRLQALPHQS